MDEYQFQHEEDPALKKAATDAVNRTLWFQHWIRYKTAFRNQLLMSSGIMIAVELFNLSPLPDHVTIAMDPRAWLYALMPLGLALLATLVTLARGNDKLWFLGKDETIKRSGRFMIIWLSLGLAALLIYLTTHLFVQYFALILLMCGWDWYQLHKLKKNLITWGILEPDGSPRVSERVPVTAQLEKSERRLDNVLGSQSLRPMSDQTSKQKTAV